MNRIEEEVNVFNKLNNEVKDLTDKVLNFQDEIILKNKEMDKILKKLFSHPNEELKNSVIKWASHNPIEAISYYIARELDLITIYYENDNKYSELFGNCDADEDLEYSYNLINTNTLEVKKVGIIDMCSYYSSISCNKGAFLELDFLNNYKVELIKEQGHFCDDNNWSVEYNVVAFNVYMESICEIIKNNFIISKTKKNNGKIKLSKENIADLLVQYDGKLELYYKKDNTFAIFNNSDLIGFICLYIDKNLEGKYILDIESFEIFSKYRGLGYGSEVIDYLKSEYGLDISGYSSPKDNSVNFWSINGAEFDSCENCKENNDCDGFECDKPLDYCFIIPNNRL